MWNFCKKYCCDWLEKHVQSENFCMKGECRDHSLSRLLKASLVNFHAVYVLKRAVNSLKVTEEFVIHSWSVLVSAWTRTFPARNYEHEHQIRLIINYWVTAPSNIRGKRGHQYKSRMVAFDAKKHRRKHHSKGRLISINNRAIAPVSVF